MLPPICTALLPREEAFITGISAGHLGDDKPAPFIVSGEYRRVSITGSRS